MVNPIIFEDAPSPFPFYASDFRINVEINVNNIENNIIFIGNIRIHAPDFSRLLCHPSSALSPCAKIEIQKFRNNISSFSH